MACSLRKNMEFPKKRGWCTGDALFSCFCKRYISEDIKLQNFAKSHSIRSWYQQQDAKWPRIASSEGSLAIIRRKRSASIRDGSANIRYDLYCCVVRCCRSWVVFAGFSSLGHAIYRNNFLHKLSFIRYCWWITILPTFVKFYPVFPVLSEINNIWVQVELLWVLMDQESLYTDCLLKEENEEWKLFFRYFDLTMKVMGSAPYLTTCRILGISLLVLELEKTSGPLSQVLLCNLDWAGKKWKIKYVNKLQTYEVRTLNKISEPRLQLLLALPK